MTEPILLTIQRAIRERLVSNDLVTAIVPPDQIVDVQGLPARFPAIILGEMQSIQDGERIDRDTRTVFADIHVWAKENGLQVTKMIGSGVDRALRRDIDVPGLVDWVIRDERYLRDPGGEHGHGILTFRAMVEEAVDEGG